MDEFQIIHRMTIYAHTIAKSRPNLELNCERVKRKRHGVAKVISIRNDETDIRSIVHAGYDEDGVFHPVCPQPPPSPRRKIAVVISGIFVAWWVFVGLTWGVIEGVKWLRR